MSCHILLLIGSYLLGSSHVFLTELRLLIFEYLRAVAADAIALLLNVIASVA